MVRKIRRLENETAAMVVLEDALKKHLIANKKPVAEVPCGDGLDGPMIKLDEVIELIKGYCVLNIPPEDEFEKGFHHAGQGLVNVLKLNYKKAD
jgi:hypothetical protein